MYLGKYPAVCWRANQCKINIGWHYIESKICVVRYKKKHYKTHLFILTLLLYEIPVRNKYPFSDSFDWRVSCDSRYKGFVGKENNSSIKISKFVQRLHKCHFSEPRYLSDVNAGVLKR